MKDSLPFTSNELIQENINRLNKRKREVWSERNPYYTNPIFEKTEIEQKIKQLEKIIKLP